MDTEGAIEKKVSVLSRASHAGLFSGTFVWEGWNTSSPKDACVGG